MHRFTTGMLASVLIALPQIAHSEPAVASVSADAADAGKANLDMLVKFVVPARMQADFDTQACALVFRNSLSKLEGFADLEAEVPGITEHMAATTTAHCQKHIPPVYEEFSAKARTRLEQTMTGEEVQRALAKIRQTIVDMEASEFQFEPGESLATGQDRYNVIWSVIINRSKERDERFDHNAENAQASAKLLVVQNEVLGGLDQHSAKILAVIADASDAGIDAGNAYAVQRGKEPFFGD